MLFLTDFHLKKQDRFAALTLALLSTLGFSNISSAQEMDTDPDETKALRVCDVARENAIFIRSGDDIQALIETNGHSKKYLIIESLDLTGQLMINPNPPGESIPTTGVIELCAANNRSQVVSNDSDLIKINFSSPIAPDQGESEAPFILVTDVADTSLRNTVLLKNLVLSENSANGFLLCNGYDVQLQLENSRLISRDRSEKVIQGYDTDFTMNSVTITGDYDHGIKINGGSLTGDNLTFTHRSESIASDAGFQINPSFRQASTPVNVDVGNSDFIFQNRAAEVVGSGYTVTFSTPASSENIWYINTAEQDISESERISGEHSGSLSWGTSVNNLLASASTRPLASLTALSAAALSLFALLFF